MCCKRHAFTLVEVLVLVATVALMLASLLPALSHLRHNTQEAACAANLRQVTLAGLTFLADHDNHTQPASGHHWARAYDPSRHRWSYDRDGRLNDWASALLPYLGDFTGETFRTQPGRARPDFHCPRDPALHAATPGHALLLADSFGQPRSPVSFGVNYDIAGLLRDPDRPDAGGAFDHRPNAPAIRVHGDGQTRRAPLETRITDVRLPAHTLLYAEAGSTAAESAGRAPLLRADSLYYTTHTGQAPALGRLDHVDQHPSGIGARIPLDRHRAAINIAFVDGHVATVTRTDFHAVRISPIAP